LARRHVKPLSDQALASLSSERLLAYPKSLLSLEESATKSDLSEAGIAALDPTLVYFKDDPEWLGLYTAVKTLLDGREHIE
jgi:hypothetical protein